MSERREIVFAFIAPLGVNKGVVEQALRNVLRDKAGYALETIKITEKLKGFAEDPQAISRETDFLKRKELYMDAGDRLRKLWSERSGGGKESGDAGALLALIGIQEKRDQINRAKGWKPKPKDEKPPDVLHSTAFLVDSFKHPHELQRLRRVYGPAFISIGLYAPPRERTKYIEREVGSTRGKEIESLIERDRADSNKLGQRAAYAFYNADFIVDTTRDYDVIFAELKRLVSLIFGDLFETPTRDELGMFVAHAAQVRSGSLSRQIGAALMRPADGSIISIGTNEAPKPIVGGQYWPDDDEHYKGRDKVYDERDTSDEFREKMADDVLRKLKQAGAFNEEFGEKMTDEQRLEYFYLNKDSPLSKAVFRDNIDHIRAVHAEAAAIIDAARHGVSLHGATLFSTTFPCHECARHIVAAGIFETVYLEPYPKSAVDKLFRDSIQIDPSSTERAKDKVLFRTFVGVAPARYLEFFTPDSDRKGDDGRPKPFKLKNASPRLPYYAAPASDAQRVEYLELAPFMPFVNEHST